jgi:hypothetical protein
MAILGLAASVGGNQPSRGDQSIDSKGQEARLGSIYTQIAKQIYQDLVSSTQAGGTTIAVTEAVHGGATKHIVAVHGGQKFFETLAQRIRNNYGRDYVPVWAGAVHAERYLYNHYAGIKAIGISNKNGPCPECLTFFRKNRFYDVWWNAENLLLDRDR